MPQHLSLLPRFVSHVLSCASPFRIILNKVEIYIINRCPVNIFGLDPSVMGIIFVLFFLKHNYSTIITPEHDSLTLSNGQC